MKNKNAFYKFAAVAASITIASILVTACTTGTKVMETTASVETSAETEPTTQEQTTQTQTTVADSIEETSTEDTAPMVTGDFTTVISGTAHISEDGLVIDNQNSDVYTGEIIIPIAEAEYAPLLLDATSGYPITVSDLIPDSYVYAYISDAMTMSLPPIANARIIFCNIPADYKVPEYVVAATTEISEDGNFMVVTGTNGNSYTIDAITAEITPYLTRNIVTLDDISADTSLLIWTGEDNHISKVVVFADDFFSGKSQSDNAR